MRNKSFVGIALLILFSTFISKNKFTINKFEIKEIEIENNKILEEKELIKIFSFLYNKNIIFLNSYKLKKNIDKKSIIEKIEIKKIFPDKLVIKVYEKKPIAIIVNEFQKKFYLGKKNDLIEYRKILKYEKLPIVEGEPKNFKILFDDLITINFPIDQIIRYRHFKVNRWDIEMTNKKILKLPEQN